MARTYHLNRYDMSQAMHPNTTPWHLTTPRAAALAILAARFHSGRHQAHSPARDNTGEHATSCESTTPTFTLTDFQLDAVHRARQILARRRGALIADSVGLGKTYIALALIEEALRAGKRVGIITPAALRPNWAPLLRKLARAMQIEHIPGLDDRPSGPPACTLQSTPVGHSPLSPLLAWTSHTRLALGTAPAELYHGLDLVIVDEAHAFRNPHTLRYRALAEIAHNARLLLITATPVNNSLDDLHALIRLFAGAGDFHDLGIPDLTETFRAAATAPRTGQTPPSIQPLLRAIMIRRTREIVNDDATLTTPATPATSLPRFPHRAPPTSIHYDLEEVYPHFLPDLATALSSLTLAPFRLGDYGATGHHTTTPVDLIRLGLLKRLESSLAAFRTSIARQLHFARAFLNSLDQGLLRPPATHRALYGQGDDAGAQLALEALILHPLPPGLDMDRLRHDATLDYQLLQALHLQLATIRTAADPKLARLQNLLDHELRHEKVLIFTEFRETARYLWRELRHRPGTALIDGGGAFLGNSPAPRHDVITRFAPRANHAPTPPPHLRVDLLIATDVLAEGLNLQDARQVISYDLPWNPVRLMQRIGRIDRIGSPHQTIFPYHFLPDHNLDELLRLNSRLHTKLNTIRETIGDDGTTMEPHQSQNANGYELTPSADEILRAAFSNALHLQPSAPPAATPTTAILPGKPGDRHSTLTACRYGEQVLFLIQHHNHNAPPLNHHAGTTNNTPAEDDATASEILLAALAHPAIHPHAAPNPSLLQHAWRAARNHLHTRLATTSAPPPLPHHAPGARAARNILSQLATLPGTPDPTLCRRVDKLLPLLARHHDTGTEARIRAALHPTNQPLPDLLHALESILLHLTTPITTPPPPTIEPIAILERRPPPRSTPDPLSGIDDPPLIR